MWSKQSDGISDKLSDLIEAIRESCEKKTEEKEKLITGDELRKLFPSIKTVPEKFHDTNVNFL